jgi:hypothetical protein
MLSGCSASLNVGGGDQSGPSCLTRISGRPDQLNGTLVLAAQSVQRAAFVPCLHRLPAGWTFHSFDAHDGQARIALDLGRDYDNALVVTLTRSCEVGDATAVTSDRPGARRFDEIEKSVAKYRGVRYYLFSGGCITLRFDVRGAAPAQAASLAARSIGVVDRGALRRYVRAYSDGDFALDPPSGS